MFVNDVNDEATCHKVEEEERKKIHVVHLTRNLFYSRNQKDFIVCPVCVCFFPSNVSQQMRIIEMGITQRCFGKDEPPYLINLQHNQGQGEDSTGMGSKRKKETESKAGCFSCFQ